jgi:hypothetical protein
MKSARKGTHVMLTTKTDLNFVKPTRESRISESDPAFRDRFDVNPSGFSCFAASLDVHRISFLPFRQSACPTVAMTACLIPRARLSPMDDDRLRCLVTGDWSAIAERMPGENIRQCRERWLTISPPF